MKFLIDINQNGHFKCLRLAMAITIFQGRKSLIHFIIRMAKIYNNIQDIDFNLNDISSQQLPPKLFMVSPDHFTVEYVINPHMEGNVGKVDAKKAKEEWTEIKDTYENAGLSVDVVQGESGLPDMVFCANQSLPILDDNGKKHVMMSIMNSEHRSDEVPYIEQYYRQQGYVIHHFPEDQISDFEGMGDAIWVNGKRIIFGGYGYRSSLEAYDIIVEKFDIPVVALKLTTEDFYHLDTCFCSLNENSVLIYPKAFTEEGLEIINHLFENVYEVPDYEARHLFACNATCPDGKNVVIQRGCSQTNSMLSDAGFTIHEVETQEYIKSGGSVFCMKMMVW